MGGFTKWLHNIIYAEEDLTVRRSRVRRVQLILAGLQIVCSTCIFFFGIFASRDGERAYRVILAGAVGLISSGLGMYGAIRYDEFATRMYFIIQMWVLSTITLQVYLSIDVNEQVKRLCHPTAASFSLQQSSTCRQMQDREGAKVFMGIFGTIIAVLSSMIALDFNDVLNDYEYYISVKGGEGSGTFAPVAAGEQDGLIGDELADCPLGSPPDEGHSKIE